MRDDLSQADPPGRLLSANGPTLFYTKLLPPALGILSIYIGGNGIVALVTRRSEGPFLLLISAVWLLVCTIYYKYTSRFRDVWLNGDRLEIRRGAQTESVPLAEVREVEFTPYARNYPWATVHIAIGARSARVIRFFPIDVSGVFRYQSPVVEELRALAQQARHGADSSAAAPSNSSPPPSPG
jgi:hypothetical protein